MNGRRARAPGVRELLVCVVGGVRRYTRNVFVYVYVYWYLYFYFYFYFALTVLHPGGAAAADPSRESRLAVRGR